MRKRYSRQEQYEHGTERKASFNRRWKKDKIITLDLVEQYEKFIEQELLPHFKNYEVYSRSQRKIAIILGVNKTTVQRIFKKLKEDTRFIVSDERNKGPYYTKNVYLIRK